MFVVMGLPSRDSRVCSSSSSIAAWPAPLAAYSKYGGFTDVQESGAAKTLSPQALLLHRVFRASLVHCQPCTGACLVGANHHAVDLCSPVQRRHSHQRNDGGAVGVGNDATLAIPAAQVRRLCTAMYDRTLTLSVIL